MKHDPTPAQSLAGRLVRAVAGRGRRRLLPSGGGVRLPPPGGGGRLLPPPLGGEGRCDDPPPFPGLPGCEERPVGRVFCGGGRDGTARAETDGAEATAASDAAAESEDAAAAADGETRHCAERTRVAQHSSDPNNPRC